MTEPSAIDTAAVTVPLAELKAVEEMAQLGLKVTQMFERATDAQESALSLIQREIESVEAMLK